MSTAPALADAPPPPPARRWVLRVGVVMSLAVVGFTAVWLVSLLGRGTDWRRTTLPVQDDRLVVTSSGGDLQIAGGATEEVEVLARLRYGLWAPRLTQESGPEGVRLAADCGLLSFNCSVDYVVTVPHHFTVEADSSSGDLTVRGVTGPVRLTTSSGDVRGEDLRAADVAVRSSSGGVSVSFGAAPRRVEVRSDSGDMVVTLPEADGYRIDADARSGDVRVDVPSDPAADRQVRARSSSGDIRVRAAPS